MRLKEKQDYKRLRKQYKTVIGWGAGVEFSKFYEHTTYQFDHMIDGEGRNVGKIINGIVVQGVDAIRQYHNQDSVLIVIYPNIETEILRQVEVLLPGADTIVARLLDAEGRASSYAADREDLIMLAYMKERYKEFSYMDIGVCHPVVRNNTYLFYEDGFHNGVLVEPNMQMCELAQEYRPLNKVVNLGALPREGADELAYYYDPFHPGLNTFSEEVAQKRGMNHNVRMIATKDINAIIAENFETYPNVLDLDTEGMDYNLLRRLDLVKYPINLICVEDSAGGRIGKLLTQRGYKLLTKTNENEIYVNHIAGSF